MGTWRKWEKKVGKWFSSTKHKPSQTPLASSVEWDPRTFTPIGVGIPDKANAKDYQFRAAQLARARREALWGSSQGAMMQAGQLMQRYRPGGAATMASNVYGQLANAYAAHAQDIAEPDLSGEARSGALREANRESQNAALISAGLGVAGAAIAGPVGAVVGAAAGQAIAGGGDSGGDSGQDSGAPYAGRSGETNLPYASRGGAVVQDGGGGGGGVPFTGGGGGGGGGAIGAPQDGGYSGAGGGGPGGGPAVGGGGFGSDGNFTQAALAASAASGAAGPIGDALAIESAQELRWSSTPHIVRGARARLLSAIYA